jgi:hypothetical protein
MTEDQQRAIVEMREREAIMLEMKTLRDDAERYRFERSKNIEDMMLVFKIRLAESASGVMWEKSRWDEELDKARGAA